MPRRLNRRRFLASSAAAASWAATGCQPPPEFGYDVLIYGATPCGIAAACAAADSGASVLLAEPTGRVGGMSTCGLSHPDFRTFEGLNGAFNEFRRRLTAFYTAKYGAASQQLEDTFRATHGEPHANLAAFETMLAARPSIDVVKDHYLTHVETDGTEAAPHISRLDFASPMGTDVLPAKIYIDATYEGDLIAMAGVEYRIGREGRDEYDESLAPEQEDGQLQGYNFRLIATQDPENMIAPERPAGYRRSDYVDLLPLLDDGTIERVFGYPSKCVYKAHIPVLPNRKYDINDVSRAPVRLSLPGENLGWPDGDHAERQRIFDEHLRWNVGLLFFLQHDSDVPTKFQEEALSWGWCKDEFVENGGLPPQLYVREARRMVGLHVYTEQDTRDAEGDARAILHADAIAMGDYGHNCHGTAHEGPRIGGAHTGEFYKQIAPYQIPYGVLSPKKLTNLLSPGAMSASHVGFCALRLEPIWMSLGQAAGHAAAMCAAAGSAVQDAPVGQVRERLWSEGGATIYVSDVPPESPDFAAVQWWGSVGGLHGLAGPQPERRGKNIQGQYYEAYPGHAAELERQLNEELYARWNGIAAAAGVATEGLPGLGATRGEWIRQAWSRRRSPA